MGKSDSSVVVALSELVEMEETRISDERAKAEAREAERAREQERAVLEAKAAEQRRAESEAHAKRVADAEARLRVEADREQSIRVEAMRAELARVEAERQTLRATLEARIAAPPPRDRGWGMAFGLSSLVAASLAGLLVMNAQSTPPVAPVAQPVTTIAHTEAVETVVVEEAAEEVEIAPVAITDETAPVTRGTGTRGRRGRHVTRTDEPAGSSGSDLGLELDDGSDDVLTPELLHHESRTRGSH